jgi:hypothetical protein
MISERRFCNAHKRWERWNPDETRWSAADAPAGHEPGTLYRAMPMHVEKARPSAYGDESRTQRMLRERTRYIAHGIQATVHRPKSARGKKWVLKVDSGVGKSDMSAEGIAKQLIIAKKLRGLVPRTFFDPKHKVFIQKYVAGMHGDAYARTHPGIHYGFSLRGFLNNSEKGIRPYLEEEILKRGVNPSDLHGGNVLITRGGRPYIIDTGFFTWYPHNKKEEREYESLVRRLEKRMRK